VFSSEETQDVDIFSREYLFDKKFAEHRNQRVMFGEGSHASRLSILLQVVLTQSQRLEIFSGPFDLGSRVPVSQEKCTLEAVAAELYGNGSDGDRPDTKDAFETIKQGIFRITNRKFQEYFEANKSTTLKVVRLLKLLSDNRLSKKLSDLKQPVELFQSPHLMKLISFPKSEDRFSLSFRDAYPYKENKEQVWLISDLKTYLGSELDEQLLEEVHTVFSSFHGLMENMNQNVGKILVDTSCSDYGSIIKAYDALIDEVRSFNFQHESGSAPLDEALFVHLHALELVHFSMGYPQLLKQAVPAWSVTSVLSELQGLTKAAFPQASKEYESLCPIEEVPVFSGKWQKDIQAAVCKALGTTITAAQYRQMLEDVQWLLDVSCRFHADRRNGLVTTGEHVSPASIVAAFCCVWVTKKEKTKFEPFWQGQQSQGGSLKSLLNGPLLGGSIGVSNVPEEQLQIYVRRLEWLTYAIRGHVALIERRFAFRAALVTKIKEICRTSDLASIARVMNNFYDFVKSSAVERLPARLSYRQLC
jgi:hypothetical protein